MTPVTDDVFAHAVNGILSGGNPAWLAERPLARLEASGFRVITARRLEELAAIARAAGRDESAPSTASWVPRPGGAVVVDEYVLPVREVRLEDGAFVIYATVTGPSRAVHATSYTVHDDMGAVVFRSDVHSMPLNWGAVPAHADLTLVVTIRCYNREVFSTGTENPPELQ